MAIAENYRQTQVMTASPMELVLMLYDEGIRSLRNAEEAFKIETPDRIEKINNGILRAQDVIAELTLSLDMEKGGEIANNLERLYDFMINHLSGANVRKTVKPLKEVRELLSELKEAWQKVAEKEPAGQERSSAGSRTGTIQIRS